MPDLYSLFKEHILNRQSSAEEVLDKTGFNCLVISSGQPFTYFADDNEAPFHTIPHFNHWCPLEGPHHFLIIRPGKRISLYRYSPEDFWYEQKPLGDPFWVPFFDIREFSSLELLQESLEGLGKVAYIGNELEVVGNKGWALNPDSLTKHLDWTRSFKSNYEVHCILEAQKLGANGHRASREAFLSGASELEIHHAFVRAVGCTDDDLPYTTIVALNEKGATLHYHGKRPQIHNGSVLLIDAGAKWNGYASDITRTHISPSCHERFQSLLKGMERIQQDLCQSLKPGMQYANFHQEAHAKIAQLLVEQNLINCGIEEALEKGYTMPFFPHGLGHHLGLQVHDVAGKQLTPQGDVAPQPLEHPYLRTTRMIEEGHVFTVEPGLYFIPMLLRKYREDDNTNIFNWKLIDELTPYGGIRIEDNVLITKSGHRNLTRELLPH